MRRSVFFVSLSCALFAMSCTEPGGVSEGYSIEVTDKDGGKHLFEGESVSCKPNTSSPDSDPLKGKYFVGVLNALGDNILNVTLHFPDYTEPPPAGTYTNGDGLDVFFSFDPKGEEEDAMRDFSTASVTVSGEAPALRIEFDPSFPGVTGYMQCGDE